MCCSCGASVFRGPDGRSTGEGERERETEITFTSPTQLGHHLKLIRTLFYNQDKVGECPETLGYSLESE